MKKMFKKGDTVDEQVDEIKVAFLHRFFLKIAAMKLKTKCLAKHFNLQ